MRLQLTANVRWPAIGALILASAFSTPCRAVAATFVSDTNTGTALGHFHYYGRWEHVRNLRDGRFFGSSSRTATVGAVVTLSFIGTIVRVYGVRGPGGGHGIVTLDGKRYPDIDFYAPEKRARVVVFDSPLLRHGMHTLAIAAVGDPRLAAHRSSYVNLSGAVYQ